MVYNYHKYHSFGGFGATHHIMMTPWVAAKHLPHTAALQLHGDLHSKRFHGKNMGKKHGKTWENHWTIWENHGKKGNTREKKKNKQTSWTIWEHMGKS